MKTPLFTQRILILSPLAALLASASLALAVPRTVAYDVPLIPQTTKATCWAASMAMLLSGLDGVSYSDAQVFSDMGLDINASYDELASIDGANTVAASYGFLPIVVPETSQAFDAETWMGWLESYGPMWIAIEGDPSHAVVLTGGTYDDETGEATFTLNDPWENLAYSDDPIWFEPANSGEVRTLDLYELNETFNLANRDIAYPGTSRLMYLSGF